MSSPEDAFLAATTRTPTLPDPSVLETFNPLEHLLNGNQGISTIPDHPEFLLRWWPRLRNGISIGEARTFDEVWQYTDRRSLESGWPSHADAEFAKLADHGIPVPMPGIDIIRFVADARRVGLPGECQYSLVRKYHGRLLTVTDPQNETLIDRYATYLKAAANDAGYVLLDVTRASQHLLLNSGGEVSNQQQKGVDESAILIDTEPLCAPVDAKLGPKRVAAFAIAQQKLYEWASTAAVTPSLIRHIGKLSLPEPWQRNYTQYALETMKTPTL